MDHANDGKGPGRDDRRDARTIGFGALLLAFAVSFSLVLGVLIFASSHAAPASLAGAGDARAVCGSGGAATPGMQGEGWTPATPALPARRA